MRHPHTRITPSNIIEIPLSCVINFSSDPRKHGIIEVQSPLVSFDFFSHQGLIMLHCRASKAPFGMNGNGVRASHITQRITQIYN